MLKSVCDCPFANTFATRAFQVKYDMLCARIQQPRLNIYNTTRHEMLKRNEKQRIAQIAHQMPMTLKNWSVNLRTILLFESNHSISLTYIHFTKGKCALGVIPLTECTMQMCVRKKKAATKCMNERPKMEMYLLNGIRIRIRARNGQKS